MGGPASVAMGKAMHREGREAWDGVCHSFHDEPTMMARDRQGGLATPVVPCSSPIPHTPWATQQGQTMGHSRMQWWNTMGQKGDPAALKGTLAHQKGPSGTSPPCKNNDKRTENDGKDTSCWSDKGTVCAHGKKTQAARRCVPGAQTTMSMEVDGGAPNGRTGISNPEIPSKARNHRENLIFTDNRK